MEFNFLTADMVQAVSMCHRARFYDDRSNHGRHISSCSIFQDGGCLPSWICCMPTWDHHEDQLVMFIVFAKCGWNWPSSYEDIRISVLPVCEFGLKMPIHAQKASCC